MSAPPLAQSRWCEICGATAEVRPIDPAKRRGDLARWVKLVCRNCRPRAEREEES